MRQKTDVVRFGTSISQVQILSLLPKFVLHTQKISPFLKIRTDFLFIISNPLIRQNTTFLLQNALFQHKTPILQIFRAILKCFLKNSFSLLPPTQILRADNGFLPALALVYIEPPTVKAVSISAHRFGCRSVLFIWFLFVLISVPCTKLQPMPL